MDRLIFVIAWLVIGIVWAFRAVVRKEYAGLLLAAGFILLAIFTYWRR
jgi:hypothetical protein